MRYKLRKPIDIKNPVITPLTTGVSYLGSIEAYHGQDGPLTVEKLHSMWPHLFDLVDTLSIKTQIVVNLTSQYVDLQKHYGFDEIGMSEKISEISERILSKI
jgi:hypothetical protein